MKLIKQIKKWRSAYSGWKKFTNRIQPNADFTESAVPLAPDYTKNENWAARPELKHHATVTPPGIIATYSQDTAPVDVFYVYPTLYFGSQNWNAALDHTGVNELIDEMVLPGQASVFNDCCRIYAPRYRQATFAVFLRGSKNGRQALDLAYQDVKKAFQYYLENDNKGRPFILAGHSQGSLHCMRLLEEEVDRTPLFEQLVAAYPIGFRFPEDKFGTTLKRIQKAKTVDDLQCVVNWDTYVDGAKPFRKLDRAEIWYTSTEGRLSWKTRGMLKPSCINPLSWDTSNRVADKAVNKGGVHVLIKAGKRANWAGITDEAPLDLSFRGLSSPYPKQVAARVGADGFLYISEPAERRFKQTLLPGKNYHLYDYALFYMDLHENVKARVANYLR